MKYFDPTRPCLPGTHTPKLLNHNSALPGLYVIPEAPEIFRVIIFLPVTNAHASRELSCTLTALGDLLTSYANDPEAFLAETFSWRPPKEKLTQLTLEDLNL